MTHSDPIADMLTRIRNANTAKHDTVDVPSSKMKLAIAEILLKEGFIKSFEVIEEGNFSTIRMALKYGADKNQRIITGIKRISKPGLRVYAGAEDMPKVFEEYVPVIIEEAAKYVPDDEKDALDNILSDPKKFKLFTTSKSLTEIANEAQEVKRLYDIAKQLYNQNQEEKKDCICRKSA